MRDRWHGQGIAAIVAAWLILAVVPVHARPPHKKALADYLGPGLARKLNDCRTCHLPPEPGADPSEDRPHNAFGRRLKAVRAQLKKAGKPSGIPARIEAIAREDSDGDGVPNLLELVTGHFPGEAADQPVTAELPRGRAQIAAIERARSGYPWNPFERVSRPTVPSLPTSGSITTSIRNPIDAFIAAEQAARGPTPRPEASRPVLLRRVTLDLTGLPPTPEELHAFLDDDSPDAYEKVVDRLLASPAYGERWGRHWMDVWRYSDWAGWGKQVRDSQPFIWHWRDWIVESLNRDTPYDRMVVAMLAADEESPDDLDALRATGYLARNFKLLSREKWMQDVVDHTGQAFLGVTLGCARCHDHMYDPIFQKEYYQVRAIFEPHQVRIDPVRGARDTAKDGIPRAFDAQPGAATRLFARGDDRHPTGDPLPPGVPDSMAGALDVRPVAMPLTAIAPSRRQDVVRAEIEALLEALGRAEDALADEAERIPQDPDALDRARRDFTVAQAQLVARYAVERAEELVDQGKKGSAEWIKAAESATAAQRELAVAQASRAELAARQARRQAAPAKRAEADKALTDAIKKLDRAREALRQPPSTNYAPPPRAAYPARSTGRRLAFARWVADESNPLTARVAVNHIWGRHFGRAIVPTVNDFGRNGQPPSHPALLDWLASELMGRGWSMKAIHRLIVTSATYRRDSRPDPAGLARDPDNIHLWRWTPRRAEAEVVRDCVFAVAGALDSALGGPDIDHHAGLTVPRRSLYFRHAAEKQMEFLRIFDAAGVTECYRRKESILPQQALALANSELTLRMARRLARSLSDRIGSSDASAFVTAAFERVLSRPPTDAERAECLKYLGPDTGIHRRESLVHVLLNHHDFVTVK
jgi:hypothetical protein